jgi:hypothetical protein
MNADELIAELQKLTPDQRQVPLIGHDRFDAFGAVVGVVPASLEHAGSDDLRPCLYVVVEALQTFEWVTPDPSGLVSAFKVTTPKERA